MSAGQDLQRALDGVDAQGNALPWRPVYGRARTILGFCLKKIPFSRGNSPSSPSLFDAIVCGMEQIASRYVASDGNVWDLHDKTRVEIELLIAKTDPAELAAARERAAVFRKWPAGFPGTPPFEIGQ